MEEERDEWREGEGASGPTNKHKRHLFLEHTHHCARTPPSLLSHPSAPQTTQLPKGSNNPLLHTPEKKADSTLVNSPAAQLSTSSQRASEGSQDTNGQDTNATRARTQGRRGPPCRPPSPSKRAGAGLNDKRGVAAVQPWRWRLLALPERAAEGVAGIEALVAELLLDSHELVVLGGALAAARRTSLDLQIAYTARLRLWLWWGQWGGRGSAGSGAAGILPAPCCAWLVSKRRATSRKT